MSEPEAAPERRYSFRATIPHAGALRTLAGAVLPISPDAPLYMGADGFHARAVSQDNVTMCDVHMNGFAVEAAEPFSPYLNLESLNGRLKTLAAKKPAHLMAHYSESGDTGRGMFSVTQGALTLGFGLKREPLPALPELVKWPTLRALGVPVAKVERFLKTCARGKASVTLGADGLEVRVEGDTDTDVWAASAAQVPIGPEPIAAPMRSWVNPEMLALAFTAVKAIGKTCALEVGEDRPVSLLVSEGGFTGRYWVSNIVGA